VLEVSVRFFENQNAWFICTDIKTYCHLLAGPFYAKEFSEAFLIQHRRELKRIAEAL
jgi:hypothetical protein